MPHFSIKIYSSSCSSPTQCAKVPLVLHFNRQFDRTGRPVDLNLAKLHITSNKDRRVFFLYGRRGGEGRAL